MVEIDAVEAGDGERKDKLEKAHDGVDDPESPAALAVCSAAFEVETHLPLDDGCCCGWLRGGRLFVVE